MTVHVVGDFPGGVVGEPTPPDTRGGRGVAGTDRPCSSADPNRDSSGDGHTCHRLHADTATLFADEEGEATVWFPLDTQLPAQGRIVITQIPGGAFAVALHDGPDARIDETYAALGTYVD